MGLPDTALRAVAEQAAASWNEPASACASPRIRIGELVDGPGRVGEDAINAIVFRAKPYQKRKRVEVYREVPSVTAA